MRCAAGAGATNALELLPRFEPPSPICAFRIWVFMNEFSLYQGQDSPYFIPFVFVSVAVAVAVIIGLRCVCPNTSCLLFLLRLRGKQSGTLRIGSVRSSGFFKSLRDEWFESLYQDKHKLFIQIHTDYPLSSIYSLSEGPIILINVPPPAQTWRSRRCSAALARCPMLSTPPALHLPLLFELPTTAKAPPLL